MVDRGEETTGTSDVTFNLISVAYHALDAADTCVTYLEDAEEDSDQELAQFFEEVIAENRKLAQHAQELLRERLASGSGASKESFESGEQPTH